MARARQRGVSTERALPTTWSANENLAWRAPLAGAGTSSPIVVGDRVIVTSQVGRAPVAGGAAIRSSRVTTARWPDARPPSAARGSAAPPAT